MISETGCGCGAGVSPQAPQVISNRPGLKAIAYRTGAHSEFKQSLLARLASQPALRALTTRDDDDFSIALLDAWASIADVLTFYQERIANEAYLRTATERLSVLQLARLIGYELRPGVAASAYLALTMEDAPGAKSAPSKIETGVKVQSIPGPGEMPQIFETIESVEARPEWNAMRPRLTERHPISRNMATLFFAGLATGIKAGDALLLFPDDKSDPVFRQAEEVVLESNKNRTLVKLQPVSSAVSTRAAATASSKISVSAATRFSAKISTFEDFFGKTVDAADLDVIGRKEAGDILVNLAALTPPPPSVFALRTRAAIFGHNAPSFTALPVSQRIGEYAPVTTATAATTAPSVIFQAGPYSGRSNSWAEQTLNNYHGEANDSANIYLDSAYPGIVKDSFVVLKDSTDSKTYQVFTANEISKSDFTLSAKVTRLTLNTNDGFGLFKIRETSVFGQSEALELSRFPIDSPVSGLEIELDGWVAGLYSGQNIAVCGELSETRGVQRCEVATIAKVDQILKPDDGFTRIKLAANLSNSYVRETVRINGNIALASHGETVHEVLGGGDGSKAFQRFALRQPPLTHVSAASASGTQSTLEIRVNDLLWREAASFFGRSPDERIYVTRIEDDGKTVVMFGDGKTGARLPTGQDNVRATYRKGIGLQGIVKADQLSLLLSRPLGLKSATNPLASGGAADPENRDSARRNATLAVLTLERVVSLQDYEDFARAFAGIAKTLASWTWNREKRGVFVTVAGEGGAEVNRGSPLHTNLVDAMRSAGDPTVDLSLQSFTQRFFRITAALQVNRDFLPEKVLAAAEQELRERFSFDSRNLGQPVFLSEIISLLQSVAGVDAVNVSEFYRSNEPAARNTHLQAALPQAGGGDVSPAELLTLDPRPVGLGVMQ